MLTHPSMPLPCLVGFCFISRANVLLNKYGQESHSLSNSDIVITLLSKLHTHSSSRLCNYCVHSVHVIYKSWYNLFLLNHCWYMLVIMVSICIQAISGSSRCGRITAYLLLRLLEAFNV